VFAGPDIRVVGIRRIMKTKSSVFDKNMFARVIDRLVIEPAQAKT